MLVLAAGCFLMAEAADAAGTWRTLTGEAPLVIAHRGASGYLPEHTLESYARAIEMGADFIEPDLVATKDGVLVARHEPMLSGTTDVLAHPEFAARRTTRNVDGEEITDWFASDFTLEEIRTLRARQAMEGRDAAFDGLYLIPTFAEIIALAKTESARRGRTIGIYPETKHPTWHQDMGLALEDRLLAMLEAEGWTEKTSPVVIQSFETANLEYLRTRTNARLVFPVDAPDKRPHDFVRAGDPRTFLDLVTTDLGDVAAFADGIGVAKDYVLHGAGETSPLIEAAHAAGLFVHAYTFRSDTRFLDACYGGDPAAEYRLFYGLGIDGVFSDFPDAALAVR